MINHLKLALWHLRQAKLAALQTKFIYYKAYLDSIVHSVKHIIDLMGYFRTGIEVKADEGEHKNYFYQTEERHPTKEVIEKERFRRYTFSDGDIIVIKKPKFITYGEKGDVVWDSRDTAHSIPHGYINLEVEKYK